ncbi:hypothetical protein HXX76_007238 [Chlamydomonas incerta]|uniref:Uncharacterized protein n=1 Tax=Chlamydomonas incerta TaxID=51695 RepID=A0A835T3B0_CHLIN|nr:hypothetical protein HXX76_007238 [Chlamydomonas incerta]|eukprot:KAG2435153.1 hypothetical protein HXX76_007238 [Chlamydomonas incerta]
MLLALLLAALRHGTLILGATDLAEVDELEELEEQPDDTLADAGRLELGFEEPVAGDVSAGPLGFVILRAPERARSEHARNRALSLGLIGGMRAGCAAALLVQVRASVTSEHMWQALSAGIALARSNASRGTGGCGGGGSGSGGCGGYPASPVHVVLTDAVDWHFMCIQATAAAAAAATMERPAGGAAAGGAAGGAAKAAVSSSGSSAPNGLDFTLKSGESFRLFNCSSMHAPMLVSGTAPADLVKVMYRLYRALYPDEDLGGLPALVHRGDM